MKKFLLKVGLFFLALIVVDQSVGRVFAYMGSHAKGGYVGHHVYVTDKTNEDILIFGSSRAIHHYNPQIITDSLGMSCYNCGQDGNGIVLFYGLWQMIKERYQPKMIIYDVSIGFDLYEGESNQKYLGWLRADYDCPGVKEIFTAIDPTERYKMMSWMYRFNSKFMQNITDYVHPIFGIDGNGFLPLNGEMDKMKIRERKEEIRDRHVDSLKLGMISKLIDELGDTKIVFVASPSWYGTSENDYQPIKEVCRLKSTTFIDLSNEEKFIHNDVYFKDGSHLNGVGAGQFTTDLIKWIKNE